MLWAPVPTPADVANSFGSTALIILLLLSGFILSKGSIHPWVVWVRAG
jgi:hypothetical protein